jgi:hypothetical protein
MPLRLRHHFEVDPLIGRRIFPTARVRCDHVQVILAGRQLAREPQRPVFGDN